MEFYKNTKDLELEGEEWRDVVGYEGLYQVSNLGRVKTMKGKKPFILKQRIKSGRGYLYVKLYKDCNFKVIEIQRLVARAFVDNPQNKNVVDHIDENKLNNCACNLRWVTHQENMAYHRAHQIQRLKHSSVAFIRPNKYGYNDYCAYNFEIGGENTFQKAMKYFNTTAYGLTRLAYGQCKKQGWKVEVVNQHIPDEELKEI